MNLQNKLNSCTTGIAGLDEILNGGLPCHSIYSIQGDPGSGKTTFALQFLLEGIKQNEKALYITFSETQKELQRVANSHGWDLANISIMDLTSLEEQINPESQNTLFHPSEVELAQVFSLILAKIDEVKPERVIFDSVSEMRLLAETALRYRRQILSLKHILADRKITVFFLDDLTVSSQDLQIHSIAHGVIHLSRVEHDFGGERRRIRVIKLRGVNFIGGNHDMEIQTGGIVVYPRMISAKYPKISTSGIMSSNLPELDQLLGGGLDRGTASLFTGPAGTGKSNIVMSFALAAMNRGERVAYFCFDETISTLIKRCRALNIDLEPFIIKDLLRIQKVDPAELSPGSFARIILDLVNQEKFSVVVIDSLNGYLHSMTQDKYLVLQMHELLAFLNNQGVVTMLTLAQHGMIGSMTTPVDLTYLTDTVLLTRFFESHGTVRKALSVIKKRTGPHENTIREFQFTKDGLEVGPELREFEGILNGVPKFMGNESVILKPKA